MSEQSLHALKGANKARIDASVLRGELATRQVTLQAALEDPRAQCMTISRLLTSQPWWGPKKTGELLNQNFIWPTRKVRDLTARQRELIVRLAPSYGPGVKP